RFFQLAEGAWIFLQGLQPCLGMALQTLLDFAQHRINSVQGGPLFAFHANFHEFSPSMRKSFPFRCPWKSTKSTCQRYPFLRTDPSNKPLVVPLRTGFNYQVGRLVINVPRLPQVCV